MKEPNEGFRRELAALCNKYCRESESNTPDFILARFMVGCLDAFDRATEDREEWYGRVPEVIGGDKHDAEHE